MKDINWPITGLIILIGLIFGLFFWFQNIDYIRQADTPVSISYYDVELLEQSIGKHVLIEDACLASHAVTTEGSDEYELIPIVASAPGKGDSTHIFIRLENPKLFSSLDDKYDEINAETVSLFQGELKKVTFFDFKTEALLAEMNMAYDESSSYQLIGATTPNHAREALKHNIICISIFVIISCIALYFHIRNNRINIEKTFNYIKSQQKDA